MSLLSALLVVKEVITDVEELAQGALHILEEVGGSSSTMTPSQQLAVDLGAVFAKNCSPEMAASINAAIPRVMADASNVDSMIQGFGKLLMSFSSTAAAPVVKEASETVSPTQPASGGQNPNEG